MKKEDRVSLLDLDLSPALPLLFLRLGASLSGRKRSRKESRATAWLRRVRKRGPPATRMRKSQGRLRERRSSSRSSSAASDDDNDNDGSERASPQEKNVPPLREQFHLGVGGGGARSSEKEEFLQGGAAVKKKKKL